MNRLSDEQMGRVAYFLEGSCNTELQAAEMIAPETEVCADALIDEILERLADPDVGVQLCTACDWWHRLEELDTVDDEYVCYDCKGNG